jgi:HK97 family phage prohead protease
MPADLDRLPTRSVPFTVTNTEDDDGDGLTMEGYAAVFDTDTEINSWEGQFTERLRRGVFRNSIRGGRRPMLQYDHGNHPLIGSIPIGVIRDLYEDEQGLFVRARLTDNWLIQPIRDAIAQGGVTGMSFRFEPIREEWRDGSGKVIKDPRELERLLFNPGERGPLTRTLVEVRLLELGPVAWPAYTETKVGVRSEQTRAVLTALQDPGVRAEVARALLVDPPTDETPEDSPDDPVEDETGDPESAPPAESEPPADEDAPPSDAPPAESEPPSAPEDDTGEPRSAAEQQLWDRLSEVRSLAELSIRR